MRMAAFCTCGSLMSRLKPGGAGVAPFFGAGLAAGGAALGAGGAALGAALDIWGEQDQCLRGDPSGPPSLAQGAQTPSHYMGGPGPQPWPSSTAPLLPIPDPCAGQGAMCSSKHSWGLSPWLLRGCGSCPGSGLAILGGTGQPPLPLAPAQAHHQWGAEEPRRPGFQQPQACGPEPSSQASSGLRAPGRRVGCSDRAGPGALTLGVLTAAASAPGCRALAGPITPSFIPRAGEAWGPRGWPARAPTTFLPRPVLLWAVPAPRATLRPAPVAGQALAALYSLCARYLGELGQGRLQPRAG